MCLLLPYSLVRVKLLSLWFLYFHPLNVCTICLHPTGHRDQSHLSRGTIGSAVFILAFLTCAIYDAVRKHHSQAHEPWSQLLNAMFNQHALIGVFLVTNGISDAFMDLHCKQQMNVICFVNDFSIYVTLPLIPMLHRSGPRDPSTHTFHATMG